MLENKKKRYNAFYILKTETLPVIAFIIKRYHYHLWCCSYACNLDK